MGDASGGAGKDVLLSSRAMTQVSSSLQVKPAQQAIRTPCESDASNSRAAADVAAVERAAAADCSRWLASCAKTSSYAFSRPDDSPLWRLRLMMISREMAPRAQRVGQLGSSVLPSMLAVSSTFHVV